MDFEYSEEQRMLADSLRRLMADNWSMERRRARQGGLDPSAWNALAELGVLGLVIDAEHGGFGEPPASLLPVHMELGAGLADEPVIPSSVMAAAAIRASGNAQAAQRWLPCIASGEAIFSVAYQEPGRRYATEPRDCRLAGLVLDGSKHLVWHAGAAHAWIVSARDAASNEAVLLVVPAAAEGVGVAETNTLDRSRCGRIDFRQVKLSRDQVLARGDAARAALDLALQWGTAALCAHAVGAMTRLLDITVDYLRTRRQFGQPLAAFQALQHRMAEMVVAREMALSMAYVAAAALDESDARARRRMIAAAKLETARAGRFLGQCAVQLHGGMAMTDELEVGDFFKRLTVVDLLLGDSAEQLAVLEETA